MMNDTTSQALLIVNDIKRAYAICYNNYLHNLKNGFNDDIASANFYHDVAFNINDILCKAYGDNFYKEAVDEKTRRGY